MKPSPEAPRFLLIDPPTPFSTTEELRSFLDRYRSNPAPEAREAVAKVREVLANR
jgi:hypothetical protein